MFQPALLHLDDDRRELSNDELAAVLHASIVRGMRLNREADLFLATICANHLVNELRVAGITAFVPHHT